MDDEVTIDRMDGWMRYCTGELVEEATRLLLRPGHHLECLSSHQASRSLAALSCSPAMVSSALLADAALLNLPTTSPLSRSSYRDVQP
jgi:hypothetical protein